MNISAKVYSAMSRNLAILATVISLSFTTAEGQDFQKGYAALQTGDYATALKEAKPLAKAGNSDAQALLGLMYHDGIGVTQDYAKAARFFQLAAVQGNSTAQSYLGKMLYQGQGVTRNYIEAARLLRLASGQGNIKAQVHLGLMFQFGQGVLQDNIMAHMWFNIASATGHQMAIKLIEKMAGQMTNSDIAKAQAMARNCMNSGYSKCVY